MGGALRTRLLLGLLCLIAAPLTLARAIPDPQQRPAPGNERPQVPIAEAGYSTAVNYQLQCAGCHQASGQGSPANDTPRMRGFVGNFLKVAGGREFLVRVPGISQSALNNAQLADMLNWLLTRDGMAGDSLPQRVRPYTAEEVSAIRSVSILNLPDTRSGLIKAMQAQGIVIEDGMPR